jgi:hypothetical protein
MRPMKIGIAKSELANACALRAQGWSYAQIGAYYGCSRQVVAKMLQKQAHLC